MESIPEHNPQVLVVDDDPGLLLSIKASMVSLGMPEPALLSDSRAVIDLLGKRRFPVVLLDLMMPHISGMDLLQQIKKEFPETACVIVTSVDDVSSTVEAMRKGAYDYLVKPLNIEQLAIVINRAMERYNLRFGLSLYERKQLFSDLNNPNAFKEIIAEDEAMALVFRQVEAVAATDYSVVITGESGTGKEMVARAIHKLSNRNQAPFLAVNMAAFTKSLFDDEFFGHTKGAYTDALVEKKGFFEQADGGTLFLDEIAELDLSLQGKLLRVIEEQELYRLGSTRVRSVDVRILSATNSDIDKEIKKGNFRADLFYRLNMYNIKIPPLRDRKKDIIPLAQHFFKIYAGKNNKKIDSIGEDLAEALVEYKFPGNVRELENIIAGAVLLEKSNALTLSSAGSLVSDMKPLKRVNNRVLTLAELEKEHIGHVLNITGGSRTKAARLLGVNTTTVYRKIEK
ncbi:MAG: sigma-54-dependent Fis family transcriptional regulator, partial [Deltaproteobacteria bacterium]|nr:sigma-54-dependent Fis family transcriptional regulator [Deltaproteobacteria bacterium]